MRDVLDLPFRGIMPPEKQKQFEKRARALDDDKDPPIVIDGNGNYTYDNEEIIEEDDLKED